MQTSLDFVSTIIQTIDNYRHTNINDAQKISIYKQIKNVHYSLASHIHPLSRDDLAELTTLLTKAREFSKTLGNGLALKTEKILLAIQQQKTHLSQPVASQPGHMSFHFADEDPLTTPPYAVPAHLVALLRDKAESFFNAEIEKFRDGQNMQFHAIKRKYFQIMLTHITPGCQLTIEPDDIFELYKTANFFQMTELLNKYHDLVQNALTSQNKECTLEFLFTGCLGLLEGNFERLSSAAFTALLEHECRENYNRQYFDATTNTLAYIKTLCEKHKITYEVFLEKTRENFPKAAGYFQYLVEPLPEAPLLVAECIAEPLDELTFISKCLQLAPQLQTLPPGWNRDALRTAFTKRIQGGGQYALCYIYLSFAILNNLFEPTFTQAVETAASIAPNGHWVQSMRNNFLPSQTVPNAPQDPNIFEVDPKLWLRWLKNRVLHASEANYAEIAADLRKMKEAFPSGMTERFHKEWSLLQMLCLWGQKKITDACNIAKTLSFDDVFSMSHIANGFTLFFVEIYFDSLIHGGELTKAQDECMSKLGHQHALTKVVKEKLFSCLALIQLYSLNFEPAALNAGSIMRGPHVMNEADWILPLATALQGYALIKDGHYTIPMPMHIPRATSHKGLFEMLRDLVHAHLTPDPATAIQALVDKYPSDSLPSNILGCYALKRRNYIVALDHFNHALALQKNLGTHFRRALCYRATSNPNCEREIDIVLMGTPWDEKAIAMKARLLLDQEGEARARAYFAEKIAIYPHFPPVTIEHAKFLLDCGEIHNARTILLPFTRSPLANWYLSQCERALGNPITAYRYCSKAIELESENEFFLEQQIDNVACLRLDLSEVHFTVIHALVNKFEHLTGITEKWQHYYLRAMHELIKPTNDRTLASYRTVIGEIPTRFQQEAAIAELRYVHLQYHRYDGAGDLTAEINELIPHLPPKMQQIVPFLEAYFTNNYVLAVQEYERTSPDSFEEPYKALAADSYRRLGKLNNAWQILVQSEESCMFTVRGLVWKDFKQTDVAKRVFTQVKSCALPHLHEFMECELTRIESQNTSPLNSFDIRARKHNHTIDAHIASMEYSIHIQYDWQRIISALSQPLPGAEELQRFPHNLTYEFLLLKFTVRNQRFAVGKQKLEEFMQRNPEHAHAKVLYGYCLIFFDENERALTYLKREYLNVLSNDQERFEFFHYLGRGHEGLNRLEQAKLDFEQAATYDPTCPMNQFRIKHLRGEWPEGAEIDRKAVGMESIYEYSHELIDEQQVIDTLDFAYTHEDKIRQGLFALFRLAKAYAAQNNKRKALSICRSLLHATTIRKYSEIYGEEFFNNVRTWTLEIAPPEPKSMGLKRKR